MQSLFPDDPVRRLSLVRLTSEIARGLASIGIVAVDGEIVRPKTIDTGRIFFTLRDRALQIRVTCAPSHARRCRCVHGERVRVTGRVEYQSGRGDLQLAAEQVVPVGAGAIAAAIAEVREKLAAEGVLDRRRRSIPRLPGAIGVVCGGGAAVRADIESVAAARFPGYPLVFEEVRVSGPGASDAVAQGLGDVARRSGVEVVILARGGGDAAELLVFSDETLCRAVAACPVPVVSAIGHEGDRPLCDEVADARFGTPSLAATATIPERRALVTELDAGLQTVADAASRAITGARQRFDRVAWEGVVAARRAAAAERLERCRHTVEVLSPKAVMGRGYAVVRSGGAVVRSAGQVRAGDDLDLELAEGSLAATVTAPIGGSGR